MSSVSSAPQTRYYRRSAQNTADVDVLEQLPEEAGESQRLTSRVRSSDFSAAIANVLAVANAKPSPLTGGVSYGKRSAQQPAEDVEVIDEAALVSSEAVSGPSERLRSAGFNAAIANVLAVANAKPSPLTGGVSYGKRSAMDVDATLFREDMEGFRVKRSVRSRRAPEELAGPERSAQVEDQVALDSEAHPSGVPASVIAQVLKAAGAKPQPVVPGDISYLGKRESERETGAVVAEVPLAAVKISPHSSHGNIVQHFDGDAGYQNSVHVSRFGRARRSDDFIPFHVYDDRRVKTLKVEQNDFLALKSTSQEKREKRNHQQEKDNKNRS